MKFGGEEFLLSEGDTYSIPANVEHAIEITEAGQVVDVFYTHPTGLFIRNHFVLSHNVIKGKANAY